MKNSLCKIMISILLSLFMMSCHSQGIADSNKVEKIRQFVACLKTNDQQKIYDIAYHGPTPPNNITAEDLRKRKVEFAARDINLYGIPEESKWKLINMGFQYVVDIPLFKGLDKSSGLTGVDLNLYFPPDSVSNKIFNFEVNRTFNMKYKSNDIFPPPRNM